MDEPRTFFRAGGADDAAHLGQSRFEPPSEKCGDGETIISLDEISGLSQVKESVDVLLLDEALNRLAELDVQQAKIVELKFFAGLTNEDTANVLGISESTVKREWRIAKAWLATQLT